MERLERRCLLEADLLGSIAGTVFNDINDDAVFESGTDVPLENVAVALTRQGDPGFEMTDSTDAEGA